MLDCVFVGGGPAGLIVCTNGHKVLTTEQKEVLQRKGIKVFEQKIKTLVGKNGF